MWRGVYKCAFMLFVAKWCFQEHNSFARMRKCNMGIHKVCMTMNRRQNKNVVSIIQLYLHCFLNTNMFASCWSQFSKRKVQQNARSCEYQPTLLYKQKSTYHKCKQEWSNFSTLLYSTLERKEIVPMYLRLKNPTHTRSLNKYDQNALKGNWRQIM